MESVKSLLFPKPNPQEVMRDWQRKLRQQSRLVDRQVRDIQREEKNVQKAIKEAAKRNDMVSAKVLAREIVNSRRAINRLYENRAQLNSIALHLGESVAFSKAVGHLSKSTEVMKLCNSLLKAPELSVTMLEFTKEMTKAGLIEEIISDAIGTALDPEDMEEEIEEEVDKVLTELAVETAVQLPAAALRKEKAELPATASSSQKEEQAIAEEEVNEEELEALRARLANVRY